MFSHGLLLSFSALTLVFLLCELNEYCVRVIDLTSGQDQVNRAGAQVETYQTHNSSEYRDA